MEYLGTNEIGYDPKSLGFPSVKTCQAIVYGTNAGLFGYHDAFGSLKQLKQKADVFVQFVQAESMNHAAFKSRFLIGIIVKKERWDPSMDADWLEELSTLAEKLHYTGGIWGARITDHMEDAQGHAAYIRVDASGIFEPRCKVRFKRQSKMEDYGGVLPPTANRRLLEVADGGGYEAKAPRDIKKVRRIGKLDEGNLVSLSLRKLN